MDEAFAGKGKVRESDTSRTMLSRDCCSQNHVSGIFGGLGGFCPCR
jgi:hypothetical protein